MVDVSLRCKHLNICLILNNCKQTFICDEFTSRLTIEKPNHYVSCLRPNLLRSMLL